MTFSEQYGISPISRNGDFVLRQILRVSVFLLLRKSQKRKKNERKDNGQELIPKIVLFETFVRLYYHQHYHEHVQKRNKAIDEPPKLLIDDFNPMPHIHERYQHIPTLHSCFSEYLPQSCNAQNEPSQNQYQIYIHALFVF